MPETALTYLRRGQRGIFAEVYFPRRVAAQGTIFTALKEGYQEAWVKDYLRLNVPALLQELQDYRHLFDPQWYDVPARRKVKPTAEDALARIASYVSPFFGWSNYVVDGVFWIQKEGKEDKMIEEATQIIRLMFRFDSSYAPQAAQAQCQDVLRAMLFWIITRQGRLNELSAWDKAEQKRFVKEHEPLSKHKRDFIQKCFEPVAKKAFKWMGDCFLFIFGYLVRKFSEKLTELGHPEEEIWVASFFNLTVSVMKKTPPQQLS